MDLKDIDLSKYEPFQYNDFTVISNLSKFFDTHRKTVKNYKDKEKFQMAEPYLNRALKVKEMIIKMEQESTQYNPK